MGPFFTIYFYIEIVPFEGSLVYPVKLMTRKVRGTKKKVKELDRINTT
jgi:hypothetical protein